VVKCPTEPQISHLLNTPITARVATVSDLSHMTVAMGTCVCVCIYVYKRTLVAICYIILVSDLRHMPFAMDTCFHHYKWHQSRVSVVTIDMTTVTIELAAWRHTRYHCHTRQKQREVRYRLWLTSHSGYRGYESSCGVARECYGGPPYDGHVEPRFYLLTYLLHGAESFLRS